MQLTIIFGSGYVGLVTGACMAEIGNHVVCYDIDEAKIDRLQKGEVPIYTVELIRIDVIHELPESERHCDHDGQLLTELGKKLARL